MIPCWHRNGVNPCYHQVETEFQAPHLAPDDHIFGPLSLVTAQILYLILLKNSDILLSSILN